MLDSLASKHELAALMSELDARSTEKDKPSFWLLHGIGWAAYVVIFSFDNLLFTYKNNVDWGIIFPLFVNAVLAACLTLPLRYLYQRISGLNPKTLIAIIVCASLLVAILWTPTKNLMMHQYYLAQDGMEMLEEIKQKASFFAKFNGLSYSFFMILIWSVLYFAINYHFRLMQEKHMHLEAARLSHSAQIKMLRYQINPHFLFNTLNAISTLVLMGNKEKANGMLSRLSTFLRFSLDSDPEKRIPLKEEISTLMLYLEIEKMRFEDRLNIQLRVSEDAENLLVPSLLLQPLIENSIKYAIANMQVGGTIEIIARVERDMLVMQVADNGDCKQSSLVKGNGNKGVGINNIKNRLSVLYGEQHSFVAEKRQPKGFQVTIKIPKEGA